MIGCNCEEKCVIEWYHLKCINLYSIPTGDWTCNDCIENGELDLDGGTQFCTCLRTANFDELVRCSSTNCSVEWYHKSCIDIDRDQDSTEWLCESCIGVK